MSFISMMHMMRICSMYPANEFCPTLYALHALCPMPYVVCPMPYTLLRPPMPSYTLLHPPMPSYTLLHPPMPSYTLLCPPMPSYSLLHPPTPKALAYVFHALC